MAWSDRNNHYTINEKQSIKTKRMNAFKFTTWTILIIGMIMFNIKDTHAQNPDDMEAIKATALNYFEGWYSADTVRMAKALSPELRKTGIVFDKENNELRRVEANYSQMIAWTASAKNILKDNPDLDIQVEILDIGKQIATVKVISPDFFDYVHMGKMNGKWKIYNVLWEYNN